LRFIKQSSVKEGHIKRELLISKEKKKNNGGG